MKKIMICFGTRPEAIKMCPLIKAFRRENTFECIICLTGQHKEMLRSVMGTFGITEDYNLEIMKKNQTLASITSDVIIGINELIDRIHPDMVLVHGDTTTSYASAVAAFYNGIPVGHVEAGLRTYDITSPFPEEFNRRSVDLISTLLFAPTSTAKNNLISENVEESRIFVTGNTVIDALQTTVISDYSHSELEWAKDSRIILVTAHRRENLGEPMRQMFKAIKQIADNYPDVRIIYPIHMNPKVRAIADEILAYHERIHIIEPLDVNDFHNFMANSYLIMTDSGGIQEEAPALGKPVLVMRNTTERPEGVEAGTLKLVGTDSDSIFNATKKLLTDIDEYEKMSKAINPYGDGHASEYIVDIIRKYFDNEK